MPIYRLADLKLIALQKNMFRIMDRKSSQKMRTLQSKKAVIPHNQGSVYNVHQWNINLIEANNPQQIHLDYRLF